MNRKIILITMLFLSLSISSKAKADNVLSEIQNEISKIETKQSDKKNEISNIKKTLEEYTKKEGELQKELKELQDTNEKLKTSDKSKEEVVKNNEAKILELEKDLESIKNKIQKRENQLRNTWNLIKITESKNADEAIKAINEIFSNKDSKLESLEYEKKTQEIKINEVTKELNNNNSILNSSKEELLTSNSSIENKKKEIEEQKEKVKKETTSLETKEKELSNMNVELNNKKSEENEIKENLYKYALNNSDTKFYEIEDQALYGKVVTGKDSSSIAQGSTTHTISMKQFLGSKFGINDFSMFRAGDQDHGTGTALDLMTYSDKEKGDKIVKYLTANYKELDIKYIIWQQRYWSPVNSIYGAPMTWGIMPDRGGITANHYDHIHISFNN